MLQTDDEGISEDITRLEELYLGQVLIDAVASYTLLVVKIFFPITIICHVIFHILDFI